MTCNNNCVHGYELHLVKSMYTEFITEKECHLYDPDKFRDFCISAWARKLFNCILNAVTTSRHSSHHIYLNSKRVLSLVKLYITCAIVSQVCNPLQNDYALYLRSCQMNQEGLETEHVMGHFCAWRTVTSVVWAMSETHYLSKIS